MRVLNSLPLGIIVFLNFYSRQCSARSFSLNATNLSFNAQNVSFNDIVFAPRLVNDPPQCDSQIYCYGKLLHTVQMKGIFKDSKTFVDMKLKNKPEQTLINFDKFMSSTNDDPSFEQVKSFVEENFIERGKEFEDWDPTDWKDKPRFLDLIRDPDLKQWGSDLNGLWKLLGRKMVKDVKENPDMYSIIHVDNPVIVPGGRFLEFYYWDSYWIIRGLLHSEMYHTARGMLSNFLSIVQRFGYIPNGGRIYYSARSQPPLLAGMINSYVHFTKDEKFALDNVDILEHEFEFWMNNHAVEVNGHTLALYGDRSSGPRPESYREDILTSQAFKTDAEKEEHYSELKAGAESGMDFSSRWFINEKGTNEGSLKDLKTRSIVPVELNAILFWNAKIIAKFHSMGGNVEKSAEYEAKAQKIQEAVHAVLWSSEDGAWFDYDLLNKKLRKYFSPTNLSPLWVHCYNVQDSDNVATSVLKYINSTGIDQYPGGVPNSLLHTGEQWDFPNVWPPMQYMLIIGLDNLNTPETKALANKWATRWVQSNFEAYRDSQAMYEKYNAEVFGGHGGGGEYSVQKGFGWTNGVIIELMAKYGDELVPSKASTLTSMTAILALLTAVMTIW